MLSPDVAGRWVQTSATTLSYDLDSPLIPSSQEVLTIPGGSHGVLGTNGATLSTSHSVTFDVAAGDTLRLQQLLAQLDFLPLGFAPTGPAPSRADLAEDQAGTFSWRWPGSAHAAHLAVDTGHRERDHQGRGRGVRDPERHRGRRDRRACRLDGSDQRLHQRQGQRHALRVRPREQGAPREPDAVGQRGGAVRRDPGEHRGPRRRHDRRHLSPSSSTCATRT